MFELPAFPDHVGPEKRRAATAAAVEAVGELVKNGCTDRKKLADAYRDIIEDAEGWMVNCSAAFRR